MLPRVVCGVVGVSGKRGVVGVSGKRGVVGVSGKRGVFFRGEAKRARRGRVTTIEEPSIL